jgi:hypothetical protein
MQLSVIVLFLQLQNYILFSAVIATVMFQQVFEKAIHAFDKALEVSEGKHQHPFWHSLIIRTNLAHDLMVLVFVQSPQDLAAGRIKHLNMKLKEFFENGEGSKCGVVSVYTRMTYVYIHLKYYQLSGFIQTAQAVNVTFILCLLFFCLLYLLTLRRLYSVKWDVDSKRRVRKNVEGYCYDLL